MTGHAFAKRLKMYARWAGIGDVHLHQTRHTFARWVSESTGSIIETQDALGHRHAATTRFVKPLEVKWVDGQTVGGEFASATGASEYDRQYDLALALHRPS